MVMAILYLFHRPGSAPLFDGPPSSLSYPPATHTSRRYQVMNRCSSQPYTPGYFSGHHVFLCSGVV